MKKMNWCDYFNTEDWKIEERISVEPRDGITDFAFEGFRVCIGMFHQLTQTNEGIHEEISPIIRWISRAEWCRLTSKEGAIVF